MAFLTQEQLAAIPFKFIGNNVRVSDKAVFHEAEKIEIGSNSRIDDFCVVSGKVIIGRNVHIAVFCNIAGGSEGITFEDFSGLAYGCHIFSQSDDYSGSSMTNPTVSAKFKCEIKKKVHIGRHCIVGTCSVIFPGVILAEGCAIGAMSMVTKPTEPWAIYSGSPAKKLKNRKRDILEMEKIYLKEYP